MSGCSPEIHRFTPLHTFHRLRQTMSCGPPPRAWLNDTMESHNLSCFQSTFSSKPRLQIKFLDFSGNFWKSVLFWLASICRRVIPGPKPSTGIGLRNAFVPQTPKSRLLREQYLQGAVRVSFWLPGLSSILHWAPQGSWDLYVAGSRLAAVSIAWLPVISCT